MFAWLLVLVPASWALANATGQQSLWTFGMATAAIVPLAEWIRRATEQLARRSGPAIGGLLTVSFGNTAEFVIMLFILTSGHTDVVKGQITGSIIGNSLLGLGLAVIAGSVGRAKQQFSRARTGQLSSLLVLSMIALLIPALFDLSVSMTHGVDAPLRDEHLSLGVSCVLIVVYLANLVYTLVTHRDVFAFTHDGDDRLPPSETRRWPLWQALAILGAATIAATVEAHFVSIGLDATAATIGLSPFFLGVILLAVVGNAAELVAGVYFARRGRMGLAISITVGSTIQVALLVAPLLVLVSAFTGHPMDLVFSSPLELVAIAAVVFAVNAVTHDGETNWFEGVLLVSIYVLLGLAFYFV
ncbi:MAG: calcium/proton exchanger [Acidobacteriota bacterium]